MQRSILNDSGMELENDISVVDTEDSFVNGEVDNDVENNGEPIVSVHLYFINP